MSLHAALVNPAIGAREINGLPDIAESPPFIVTPIGVK